MRKMLFLLNPLIVSYVGLKIMYTQLSKIWKKIDTKFQTQQRTTSNKQEVLFEWDQHENFQQSAIWNLHMAKEDK